MQMFLEFTHSSAPPHKRTEVEFLLRAESGKVLLKSTFRNILKFIMSCQGPNIYNVFVYFKEEMVLYGQSSTTAQPRLKYFKRLDAFAVGSYDVMSQST